MGEDERTTLLPEPPRASDESPHSGDTKRTGTLWTAVAHIVTAVIGAGVLSLAWSFAQLGWVGGPLCVLFFAATTLLQSQLLADCYRSPDPEYGPIRNTYMGAVRLNLGEKSAWICGIFQQVNLYGVSIAYTIQTTNSMRAIQKSNCYHKKGHDAPRSYDDNIYMLLFGVIQVVCSQIPDFHNMAWLSVVAAIMSFSYSSIGFGLGLAKVIENGTIKGSISGVAAPTTSEKVWKITQALGDVAFAYPFSLILLEIEDTLKSPPPENRTMKKASTLSVLVTTCFYLCCGCFGYAAFGNSAPGNLLTGFGFFEPCWLVDFANACIVLHLVGGYQVYSQPVFGIVDRWFADNFPDSGFVNNFYAIPIPFLKPYRVNLLRLCFRTVYVATTTGVAMIFPYFNQILGVIGALNFWPLAIYFPVEMYFVQRKVRAWTKRWVVLRGFSLVSLLVSVVALVGSLEGLISEKLS